MSKNSLPAKRKIGFMTKGNEITVKVADLQILHDLFGTADQRLSTGLLTQAVSAAGSDSESVYKLVTSIIENSRRMTPWSA